MRISWDFPWLCWIAGGRRACSHAPWRAWLHPWCALEFHIPVARIHRCSSIRSPSFIVLLELFKITPNVGPFMWKFMFCIKVIPIWCLYQNLDSNLTIIHIYIYTYMYIYINNYIMLYIYIIYITIIIVIYHIKRNSWLFSQRPLKTPHVGSSRRWALRSRRLTGEAWDAALHHSPLVKCYKKHQKTMENMGKYWKTHHLPMVNT